MRACIVRHACECCVCMVFRVMVCLFDDHLGFQCDTRCLVAPVAEAMEAEHEDIVVATSAETLEARRKFAAERFIAGDIRLRMARVRNCIHALRLASKPITPGGIMQLYATSEDLGLSPKVRSRFPLSMQHAGIACVRCGVTAIASPGPPPRCKHGGAMLLWLIPCPACCRTSWTP